MKKHHKYIFLIGVYIALPGIETCILAESHIEISRIQKHNIFNAVKENDRKKVNRLIKAGLPFNLRIHKEGEGGWTPLHVASTRGYTKMVKLLLTKAHVSANIQDITGFTPLHFAAQNDFPDIVQLLINLGNANPNLQTTKGWTTLHSAVYRGRVDIVRILLHAGVDTNIRDKKGRTAQMLAKHRGYHSIARLIACHRV